MYLLLFVRKKEPNDLLYAKALILSLEIHWQMWHIPWSHWNSRGDEKNLINSGTKQNRV